MGQGMRQAEKNPVAKAFDECRPLLYGAFGFGFFINILMLAVPIYSLQVLDRVLSSGSLDTLAALTVMAVVALIFMGILQALRLVVFSHIGRWLDDRLSDEIVEKTVTRAVGDPSVGTQPLRDLNTLRNFVTSQHLGTLFDAPFAIIFFIVIYAISVPLGIAVTFGAVVLGLLAFLAQRLPSAPAAMANDEQVRSMQSIDALVRNAEVVKAMGLLHNATIKWRWSNQRRLSHSFLSANLATVIAQITRTIRLGLQIAVMGFGAYLALNDLLSPGAIIAVSILTARALAPFDAAAPLYQSLVGVLKALQRLDDLHLESMEVKPKTMRLPEAKGNLILQKVTYEAPGSGRWILRGINLEIPAGTAVGIIGPSGSGKTTLARMIVGVLQPTTGMVRLDGAALHQWDSAQLSRAIGYLPQGIELFDGTIAENIARLDPNPDDDAVIQAAQTAMVHEAILAFPKGYHTDIGPGGALLSAGQRQRIALARCFYGDPKLIVLDEPNANLDGEGEIAFAQALGNAKRLGITTLTIAHRPQLLRSVDKTLVMQNGEARIYGPTDEVMAELSQGLSKIQPLPPRRQGAQS
ncbi:MAG: type I secretion system permease/ATPase [Pseudomonadota bacterium]